jgi:hypothetical protein
MHPATAVIRENPATNRRKNSMRIRSNPVAKEVGGGSARWMRFRSYTSLSAAVFAVAVVCGIVASSQQSPPPRTPHPILLPEANHLPDVNDQLKLHQQNTKKQNFDAANAERKREMDDESTKLLILAKDLKTQVDSAGRDPLSQKALREAEVIEMLARDVKEKMKLTVGGS